MHPQDTYDDVVEITEVPSEEELVQALRCHTEIRAANEWRPLAHHVRGIIRACLKGAQKKQ